MTEDAARDRLVALLHGVAAGGREYLARCRALELLQADTAVMLGALEQMQTDVVEFGRTWRADRAEALHAARAVAARTGDAELAALVHELDPPAAA